MPKLFINTMGCQMNVYDSTRMADALKVLGYELTDNQEDADMLIINTCHIREKATDKVFSEVGRFGQIKEKRQKEGKDTLIALAGCVVQALGDVVLRRYPIVDIAVGPQSYHELPELVTRWLRHKGQRLVAQFSSDAKFDHLPKAQAKGPTAFLAIQEGCDHFCSYCVVPYTRGCEYSRPLEDVRAEAQQLVDTGAVEITLLGQNVDCWHGKDKEGKTSSLAQLFYELSKIEGLQRLRYTTSYPTDITKEMVEAHKSLPKLMPYIHLPIQSGSDSILKAMNRHYTVEDYMCVVQKLKEARPDMAISSDFIVGFPGETEKDFEDTLAIVDRVAYAQSFSFKYSARPGTPASLLRDQIPETVKTERLAILQEKLLQHQKAYNLSYIGKTLPVLLAEKTKKGQWLGYSPYLQNVHVESQDNLYGKIVDLKITDATASSLTGQQ